MWNPHCGWNIWTGSFLITRPVLERRGQVHPERNRTLEQQLRRQIWKFCLFWVQLVLVKRPCKSQGTLIVQGRVDIEDIFWMLLDQHLHERLMRNKGGTTWSVICKNQDRAGKMFEHNEEEHLTWAPFMNGSTLSARSFSSRDFTLQPWWWWGCLDFIFIIYDHWPSFCYLHRNKSYDHCSDIRIATNRPGQVGFCPFEQGLLLEIHLQWIVQMLFFAKGMNKL